MVSTTRLVTNEHNSYASTMQENDGLISHDTSSSLSNIPIRSIYRDQTLNDQPPTSTTIPQPPSASTLLSLPTELQHLIIKQLDWPSLCTLRLGCTHFGTVLLPASTLRPHHSLRSQLTSTSEMDHYITTTSNPRPAQPQLISWSPTLPCYRCLRWLPTTGPTGSLTHSAFTRRMALVRPNISTGTHHLRRVCISCGIKTKLYVRGNRVGHRVICRGCGGLGEELGRTHYSDQWSAEKGPPRGLEVRLHHYCRDCVERDRGAAPSQEQIQAGMVPASLLEFRHWRQMGGYEAALRRGKQYRLDKGGKVRAERGVEGCEGAGFVEPKRVCETLGEKRWCLCWKWTPTRPGFLGYHGPLAEMW